MFPIIPIAITGLVYKVVSKLIKSKPIGTIKSSDIEDIIISFEPRLTDETYSIFTFKQLENFIEQDTTNEHAFIKDAFDCDNYAFMFYVMAEQKMPGCLVGVAFCLTAGGKHAMNCFIDENKDFWLIEPQTDEIRKKKNTEQVYFCLI